MKKIVFITFYDIECIGIRLLSSIAKRKGVQTDIVILKNEMQRKPVFKSDMKDDYTSFYGGILRNGIMSAFPPSEHEMNLFLHKIIELKPDLICLSTRTFALKLCRKLIPVLRDLLPGIPIIGGGWGPTCEPEKFLEFCDYAVIVEGEKTMEDIVDNLINNRDFKNINNIVYKNNDNTLTQNPVYPPLSVPEMNNLLFVDKDLDNQFLINDNRMQSGQEFYNNDTYSCFIGRGCPLSCSYCMSGTYQTIYKEHGYKCPKFRIRDIEKVVEELAIAKQNGKLSIRFMDEVFPFNKEWLEKFFELYSQKVGLPFFAYLRLEFHDEETIKRLVKCGLTISTVGIQSGSDRLLKEVLNRKLSSETTLRFAKILKELDIQYVYHFLTNNPFEKEEDLIKSFELCCQLPYATSQVYRTAVFPSSELDRMIKEKSPQSLPKHIYDWYSMLYCMATENPTFRKISKFIFKFNILKRFPLLLQIFFLPKLIKEIYIYFKTYKEFNRMSATYVPHYYQSKIEN
jgi:anaerobic magnesium-protoporphyrin IX monomethyl ester cyclase